MELQQLRKPFAEIEKSNAVILSDFTSDKYRKISLKVSEPTQKQIEAAYSEISKHLSNFDTTKAPYSIFKKDALSLLNEYFYFWKPIKIIRLVIPRDSSEPTRLHELFANNITDLNFDDKGGLSYMTGGGKGTVEFNIVSDFGIKGAKSTERYAQFLNYAKFD